MPIDSSHNIPSPGVAGLRAINTVDARTVRLAAGAKESSAVGTTPDSAATQAATFQPSQALDPGQAPVDMDRVKVIRRAIETGTYPILPTKIADAMIAAGLLLSTSA